MRKIVIIATIVTVLGVTLGMGIAALVCDKNNDRVAKMFIGNVEGMSEQDIRLCQGSYLNGGRYYKNNKYFTLECRKNHISVDIKHPEE